LRNSTEGLEAVIYGFARIVGVNPIVVLAELEKLLSEEVRLSENRLLAMEELQKGS